MLGSVPSVWSHYDAARCLRKAIVRDLALSMPERVLDDFGGAVAVVAAGGFGWAWGILTGKLPPDVGCPIRTGRVPF